MDFLYVLLLVTFVLALIAQFRVKGTFKKYSKQLTESKVTGAQAAQEILQREGLSFVQIERVDGELTDHFDPRSNTVRLSDSVYDAPTVAAVGVAAHEVGHAIQHNHGYVPIKIRSAILPAASFGSKAAFPLILIGFFLGTFGLVHLGIILYAAVALFQIVTLPVEFNASSRALYALENNAILTSDELRGSKKVLSAAAMTYVAALAVTLIQLVRFIAMSRR